MNQDEPKCKPTWWQHPSVLVDIPVSRPYLNQRDLAARWLVGPLHRSGLVLFAEAIPGTGPSGRREAPGHRIEGHVAYIHEPFIYTHIY